MIALPGRAVFVDLIEPVLRKNAKPEENRRYGLSLQISKDSAVTQELWAAIQEAAIKGWGDEAGTKLQYLQSAIQHGVKPAASPIWLQDGDLYQPEYNRGFWMLTARRREDKGAPTVLDIDGSRLDPVNDADRYPRMGDGVMALINVWCQPDYDRMNFSLEGVRLVVKSAAVGGPDPNVIAAAVQSFASMSLPAIPGIEPAAGGTTSATIGLPSGHVRPMGVPPVPTNTPLAAPLGEKPPSLFSQQQQQNGTPSQERSLSGSFTQSEDALFSAELTDLA